MKRLAVATLALGAVLLLGDSAAPATWLQFVANRPNGDPAVWWQFVTNGPNGERQISPHFASEEVMRAGIEGRRSPTRPKVSKSFPVGRQLQALSLSL